MEVWVAGTCASYQLLLEMGAKSETAALRVLWISESMGDPCDRIAFILDRKMFDVCEFDRWPRAPILAIWYRVL